MSWTEVARKKLYFRGLQGGLERHTRLLLGFVAVGTAAFLDEQDDDGNHHNSGYDSPDSRSIVVFGGSAAITVRKCQMQ